jgi:Tfp pilus assembly protein PilN
VGTQEAELEKLNQRLVTLNAHLRNRDANLEALRELSRVLPADSWISSYSYQDAGVSVGGLSGSASQVQKALEDSPVFRDAQQTATVIKDPSGKDRFSIRAAVEQAR